MVTEQLKKEKQDLVKAGKEKDKEISDLKIKIKYERI